MAGTQAIACSSLWRIRAIVSAVYIWIGILVSGCWWRIPLTTTNVFWACLSLNFSNKFHCFRVCRVLHRVVQRLRGTFHSIALDNLSVRKQDKRCAERGRLGRRSDRFRCFGLNGAGGTQGCANRVRNGRRQSRIRWVHPRRACNTTSLCPSVFA